MSLYNAGRSVYFAKARGRGYQNIKAFTQAVDAWLEENNIETKWDGEDTSTIAGVTTYTYYFRCYDEKDAVLVALRWA